MMSAVANKSATATVRLPLRAQLLGKGARGSSSVVSLRRASRSRAASLRSYRCAAHDDTTDDRADRAAAVVVQRRLRYAREQCRPGRSLPEHFSQAARKVTEPEFLRNTLDNVLRTVIKSSVLAGLATLIALQFPGGAHAARSGGRMGGGDFRSRSAATTFQPSMQANSAPLLGNNYAPTRSTVTHVHVGSTPYYQPVSLFSPMAIGYQYGTGTIMFAVMFMALASVFAMNMLQNLFGGGGDDREDDLGYYDGDDDCMTVIRVQVAMLGSARQVQLDLERIVDRADTESEEGLHYILTETVLSLLRSPQYWAYGGCASASARTPEAAEERFGSLSMEERSKMAAETLVSVDGRRKQAEALKGDDSTGQNDYIVVTILAAVDGAMRMPKVQSSEDIRAALTRLGGVRMDQVAAVEVLWTPQDVNDTLTADDLLADYPKLLPL